MWGRARKRWRSTFSRDWNRSKKQEARSKKQEARSKKQEEQPPVQLVLF
jgi:hypothetical protein